MIKISKINEKLHTPLWLFVLLIFVLILRIPSFFEPYSYGDEMIYLSLGEAIKRNITLYKNIHDNKPPLLYLTASISGNLFVFKVILALWNLTSVFIFWKLTELLFPKKEKFQKVSTVAFALLTTLPLLEGNIANAEIFMVGPTLLAFYLLLKKKLTVKKLFAAGLLFSMASLYKIPAAFDLPVIIAFWLFTQKKWNKKAFKDFLLKIFYLGLGFLLPILASFAYYYLKGAFDEYLIAAYLQNVGYLSSWRPSDAADPFLARNAPLLTRAGIVTLATFILFLLRKKLNKVFIFSSLWLVFSLFAVTLPERPYPHYLIQSVPAISILLAFLFTSKKKEQTLSIVPLTLAFLVPFYYKFWYYPTGSYYTRFAQFATGQMSKNEYLKTFGGNTIRNYKVSQYVNSITKKDDGVFVWGNSSVIYALSRRLPPIKYVADYHINDFSSKDEVLKQLKHDKPQVIVILDDSDRFRLLDAFVESDYVLLTTIDNSEVWKLIN